MPRFSRPAAVVGALLFAASAGASEPAEKPPAPQWSVGVGVGTEYVMSSSSGILAQALPYSGGYYLAANTQAVPNLSLVVERRLGEGSALLLRGSLVFSNVASRSEPIPAYYSQETSRTQSATGGGLTFGYRGSFFTASRVALSWFAAGGASYTALKTRREEVRLEEDLPVTTPTASEDYWQGVGVAGGLICDFEILPQLALRLSSSLLQASYGWSSGKWASGSRSGTNSGHSSSAGFTILPSLELRMLF